jgi:hypothetical protein
VDGRDSIPGRGSDCSLLHSVQTGSVAQLVSYLVGIGGSFFGGKAAGV